MSPTVLLGSLLLLAAPPEPAPLPIGLDAYRHWERWPQQRIGVRAYMRSTYDRRGGNEAADASHFLYQEADDFSVSLDTVGPGLLYFVRTNHWHGSPWHYEVDGVDHLIAETATADPVTARARLTETLFLPTEPLPNPLTWTWSTTKGADLNWVPIGFIRSLRLAYSRTHYGTGYYIYHLLDRSAPTTQPLRAWDGRSPPDADVLELLRRSGTELLPGGLAAHAGEAELPAGAAITLAELAGPATLRAIELSVPRAQAVDFGRARLRVTWDGRAAPSIDAPVALFFGAGTLYNRDDREYLVRSLPITIRYDAERVHLACVFPMPYFGSARVELVGGESTATVRWRLRTAPLDEHPSRLGYFHASYADHPEPVPGEDLLLLDTRGAEGADDWSGSFVGASWIFSHRGVLNTLEGDPRFFFDDARTPQAYGTGTEEWGGGGDYWGGRNMTLPLAGHPCGAPSPAAARDPEELIQSAYRFLLADLMPFGRRAVIRLEHGGTNQSTEHYETVSYWYGAPAATLVPTDSLDLGDQDDERAHGYLSPDASAPYHLTSRFEWGPDTIRLATGAADAAPLAEPEDRAEFDFAAAAGTYHLWLLGANLDGSLTSDAVWLQFDQEIGTTRLGAGHDHAKGFGNWGDAHPSGADAWSSALPGQPPQTVTFTRGGGHRLRLQPRHPGHRVEQILLSPWRDVPPDQPTQVTPAAGEIALTADDATALRGRIERGEVDGRPVLLVGVGAREQVVYPPHEEVGRVTTGASEFTLALEPDNYGVVLRRTLDYAYPNQRAEVYVADAGGEAAGPLTHAGTWYLAGSNTCVYSNPRGELGATEHHAQTSNRRFRDDEFIVPRALTRGLERMRVRLEFVPVARPLYPGHPLPDLAWSEIRYDAYCWRNR